MFMQFEFLHSTARQTMISGAPASGRMALAECHVHYPLTVTGLSSAGA